MERKTKATIAALILTPSIILTGCKDNNGDETYQRFCTAATADDPRCGEPQKTTLPTPEPCVQVTRDPSSEGAPWASNGQAIECLPPTPASTPQSRPRFRSQYGRK